MGDTDDTRSQLQQKADEVYYRCQRMNRLVEAVEKVDGLFHDGRFFLSLPQDARLPFQTALTKALEELNHAAKIVVEFA